MKLYKSYVFRNKDPAIDELRTVMQEVYGNALGYKEMHDIEVQGGPTAGTLHNWFFGTTRRPQNATLEAAGRAMGYKRVWVKDTPTNGKRKK